MSTEERARPTPARALRRALAALAIGLLGVLAGAASASAEQSPAASIVAALRQSPVYVDPSLSSAVPPAQQQQLAEAIGRGSVAINLVIVPLVTGDAWGGKPEALATVVHDRMARDGVFVTLSDFGNGDLSAYEWPPGLHQARYAAWAPSFEENLRHAGLYPRLTRAVELIQSGTGKDAYEKASSPYRGSGSASPSPASSGKSSDPGLNWEAPFLAVGLVGGTLAVLALSLRRKARPKEADSFRLPRQVFVAARQANDDELRARASDEVVAFGEVLDKEDFTPAKPAAQADLQRALDAYMAAGKVADAATRTTDWVGVLVLVDTGRDAYAAARAREAGRPVKPPTGLCFFNPLHGDSVRTIDFRPIGQRAHLRVPACAACAEAVRERRAPEVLTDLVDGHEVPYFEVDSDHSVWASTGYGALRHDLVARILRGDLHRTTHPG